MTEQIHSEELPIIKHPRIWPQFHIIPQVSTSLSRYVSDVNAIPVLKVSDDALNKLLVVVRPVVSIEPPKVGFTVFGTGDGNDLLPYTGNVVIVDKVMIPGRIANIRGTVFMENCACINPDLTPIDLSRISRAARMIGFRPEMLHHVEGKKAEIAKGIYSSYYELPINSEQVLEQLQLIVDGPKDDDVTLFLTPQELNCEDIVSKRWRLDMLDYTRSWKKYIIHNEMLDTDNFGVIWREMWRTIERPIYAPGDEDYDFNEASRYIVHELENGALDYSKTQFLQCWYNFAFFVQFRTKLKEAPRVRISDAEHHRMVNYAITSGQMGPIHFRERSSVREFGKVFVEVLTDTQVINFEFIMAKHSDGDDDTNLPMSASTLWGGVLHRGVCEFDQYALEGILAVTQDAYRHQLQAYVNPNYRVNVTFEAPEV